MRRECVLDGVVDVVVVVVVAVVVFFVDDDTAAVDVATDDIDSGRGRSWRRALSCSRCCSSAFSGCFRRRMRMMSAASELLLPDATTS